MGEKPMAATPFKILVVDDSPDTREVVRRHLEADGYRVFTADGVEEAVRFLSDNPIDLIVTDFKMPKVSGMDLVRHVRENFADAEIMMITGYPTIATAVEAVKTGAEEYLVKPFTEEELRATVKRTLEKLIRRRKVHSPTEQATDFGIVGESPAMQQVYKFISKAAESTATVLIAGESGTGKELIARAVHYNSSRRAAPFVTINCTAIPDSLLESELFGHVKGAFTGAADSRAGFFQVAHGGTLFLDEIGDASPQMQAKLLRAIQDKTMTMVGSSRSYTVDTRLVAATNKDLLQLVRIGLFREDLYYRLNVVNINIPPLRVRQGDILLLINAFMAKHAREMNRPLPVIQDAALRILTTYHWPGNVRELENLIQRLVVLTEGDRIDAVDLPAAMRFCVSPNKGLNRTLVQVELDHIRDVLATVNGNKTQAARILGIDRKTLREKLKKIPPL
jgi:two-component system, NtrC family, response regulator HydG